jgi:nickel/cobalt exporter
MTENLLPALAFAALALGALHTLAPDHWVPFAAVGRARRWSLRRTGTVTLVCGLGHVAVSAVLGLSALLVGTAVVETWGIRLTSLAALLWLAFGAGYGVWGLVRATHRRLPGLGGSEASGDARSSRGTVTSLFVLFALDPCVPLIPLVGVAAALGVGAAVTVLCLYAAATVSTMTLLAVTARAGAGALRAPWLDRWGHAAAGALILLVGVVVGLVGI